MPSPIDLALSSLLPTLSPLPTELTDLATSLLAQSRSRASSLKAEEEIGRTYACCHIACERLGKKLGLEIGKPAPPVQPRVYGRLKGFLGSTLRTPVTPRGRGRVEDKLVGSGSGRRETRESAQGTPTGRGGGGTPGSVRSRMLGSGQPTPTRIGAVTPSLGRKRKVDVLAEVDRVDDVAPLPVQEAQKDTKDEDEDEDGEDDATPVKRPSKTPLRRKEKHAKFDDGVEDVGAAGLLPGLGTMFQPAIDWLTDERRAECATWKKGIMREMAVIETQTA